MNTPICCMNFDAYLLRRLLLLSSREMETLVMKVGLTDSRLTTMTQEAIYIEAI